MQVKKNFKHLLEKGWKAGLIHQNMKNRNTTFDYSKIFLIWRCRQEKKKTKQRRWRKLFFSSDILIRAIKEQKQRCPVNKKITENISWKNECFTKSSSGNESQYHLLQSKLRWGSEEEGEMSVSQGTCDNFLSYSANTFWWKEIIFWLWKGKEKTNPQDNPPSRYMYMTIEPRF